jgi:carbon storage regulator CsrA
MLVLSRRLKEKLYFPGIGTAIHVTEIKGRSVRLGIEAPPHVSVLREEVLNRSAEVTADDANTQSFDQFLHGTTASVEMARLALQAGRTGDVHRLLDTMREDLTRLRQEVAADGPPL